MKKLTIVLVAVMGFAACQKEVKTSPNAPTTNVAKNQTNQDMTGFAGAGLPTSSSFGSNYEVLKVVNLLAGQTNNVGNVTVSQDDGYVYVTYNFTSTGNKISELHLFIGDSLDFPVNPSGNPVPGQFPNKITFKKVTVNSYTFAFPTADINDDFFVAAHCVVGGDTAWGDGTQFPGASQWGMYFKVHKASHPTEG